MFYRFKLLKFFNKIIATTKQHSLSENNAEK